MPIPSTTRDREISLTDRERRLTDRATAARRRTRGNVSPVTGVPGARRRRAARRVPRGLADSRLTPQGERSRGAGRRRQGRFRSLLARRLRRVENRALGSAQPREQARRRARRG